MRPGRIEAERVRAAGAGTAAFVDVETPLRGVPRVARGAEAGEGARLVGAGGVHAAGRALALVDV